MTATKPPTAGLRHRGWASGVLLTAFALGASSCGISLQSLPKIGGVSGPTYKVTATFANVVNLPENAQVRVGAFAVGFVSSIAPKDFKAIVTMKVKKNVKLPIGTTAAIHFDTPLGEDFVELQSPSTTSTGPFLVNGSQIPESDTLTAPSVEDAFGALGALLNGGGINQLQTIVEQTNLALNGNQLQIRSLLNSLNATVTSFAQNTPSIDNALTAIASLSTLLNQGSGTITRGIAALGPAVGILGSENKDLTNLLVQLDNLSTVTNNIIQTSSAGTVKTLQALQPLLTQLTSVQQQVGPALTALDALEQKTPAVAPGDYLQLAINATIELPPVPSDALPLHKVTVDPPEPSESYSVSAIQILLEGGLP
jgi:phospholipid/cholesterol/gamma-HCH transport system substrate-binding protein